VWLIYYLHQRSVGNIKGKGAAEWEDLEQKMLLLSEGPTEASSEMKNSNLIKPGTAVINCSPSPSSVVAEKVVRLHEADVEILRTEVFKIADSVLSSKEFGDAVELRRGEAVLTTADQLPPAPTDSQLLRLSDEQHHPNPTSNIPGVQDVHAELREYTERILETWTSDFSKARKRQHRPTAAELGLQAIDSLEDIESLNNRIAFLNELIAIADAEKLNKAEKLISATTSGATMAIATTTSVDVLGVRREILPWLQYHTEIGVTRFYILYDGNDSAAVESLQSINHVEVLNIHAPWASPEELALWDAHSKLSTIQWQGSQGNYELMKKQGFCLQQALRRAQERNQAASQLTPAAAGLEAAVQQQLQQVEWLMHLDPDELLLPGGNEATIISELSKLPLHIPAVRFLNFEGQPEAGAGIVNRFEQVTLFRAHKHFITPEAFWYRNRFKLGENTACLYLYANGKSAVRVNAPGVRHSGPHYFTGSASERWVSPENPAGLWVNAVSDSSIVLHYAYSNPSEVAAKAHRSCPGNSTATAAGAGNRELVKKTCFIIEFDADAFMAAVQGEDAVNDFYYSRMVLSEGVAVRCAKPGAGAAGGLRSSEEGWCALSNIPRFVHLMEKIGLFKRVLLPQAILRQQERIFQNFWLRRLDTY
jgi:hypothetical protein